MRIVRASGEAMTWILAPSVRRTATFRWPGRLPSGDLIGDGRYRIELVAWPRVLASVPLLVDAQPARLTRIRVSAGRRRFAGDNRFFATISPNGDGLREGATVRFRLSKPARVRLEVLTTRKVLRQPVWTIQKRFKPGRHSFRWRPKAGLPPRTYVLRLVVVDQRGRRRVYGGNRRLHPWIPRAPVVRLLGIEAGFRRRSYAPGQLARLVVAADAAALTAQIFRAGHEDEPTYRNDELRGVPVTDPSTIDWRGKRLGPRRITVRVGDWPSGLYFVRLRTRDGRIGFAPFIVRPGVFGRNPVAVVLPTNTWQAYNFRDANGDGWGDTWYAGGNTPVGLARAFLNRGVPFRFRSYDLGFLRWIARSGRSVDVLSEEDLERFGTGDRLAAAYRLVIFPGHTEYVTKREYDIVERYRDLGGDLWFLSANNFFWRVERKGQRLVRTELWRRLGRPEAALIGVQYVANDDGSRQAGFVAARDAPSWAWDGTGLAPGERFGSYGIEIDARAPSSPPGTLVLATVPDLFGPGKSAEMTWYETAAGAKVFAAGALNFGGSAERWAVRRLLENLWALTFPRETASGEDQSPSSSP